MRNHCTHRKISKLLLSAIIAITSLGQTSGQETKPIRTFFVTRSLAHERLFEYLETARPEIVQVGNYGAMFHGFADNPRATKSPMMLPVVGERPALNFQRELNERVHDLGLRTVGHFRLVKVMADWQEQSGFVEYYNKRWPTDLLGSKPHPQLIELLQRNAEGQPIQVSRYDNAQLTLCLSSPHARRMLKAMLKCAIDHGVDGVMTTYNYHFECACPYCQTAFKNWLRYRLSDEQIRDRLGIDKLEEHKFSAIPARIPGYPKPDEASDLTWLATRWAAEHFKRMYDDIFVTYGRSLKKDLIVGQWNHLGHVGIGEERAFLRSSLWGKNEDYFWYSGGASFVRKNLNLKEGKAGDAWLSCLYVRELANGKPFVMGKYDGIRLAASMAEGYATGGLGMGRYMRFEQPSGFKTLVRYTNFMHRHRRLYDNFKPYADVALVLPRQSIWNGRPEALDEFRNLGQALVERQVLIDVVADENLTAERLADYKVVLLPNVFALSDTQLKALREYTAQGGHTFHRGDVGSLTQDGRTRTNSGIPKTESIRGDTPKAAAEIIQHNLQQIGATTITSPWTVRVTAYANPDRTVLHLVNYDRDETINKKLQSTELERPNAVENVGVDFRLPKSRKVDSIRLYAPNSSKPLELTFDQTAPDRVKFNVPSILVYAVVEIR